MSVLLPAAAIAIFVVGSIVWRVRDGRKWHDTARDDTVRVGTTDQQRGDAVARSAARSTAWVQLSDPSGP